MREELDVILKLTKKDEEEIKEAVRAEKDYVVRSRFGCINDKGIVSPLCCYRCQHMHKIDIRNPGLFGCYVTDYIRQVKGQLGAK